MRHYNSDVVTLFVMCGVKYTKAWRHDFIRDVWGELRKNMASWLYSWCVGWNTPRHDVMTLFVMCVVNYAKTWRHDFIRDVRGEIDKPMIDVMNVTKSYLFALRKQRYKFCRCIIEWYGHDRCLYCVINTHTTHNTHIHIHNNIINLKSNIQCI